MSDTKNKPENGTQEAGENKTRENPLIVWFDKPVKFEGKEYAKVDLTKLENMNGEDMFEAENTLRAMGLTSVLADLSVMGIYTYAMMASGQPLEFFQKLPLRDSRKVKTRILNFFWE